MRVLCTMTHSLLTCHLAIKLYCVALFCIVLYSCLLSNIIGRTRSTQRISVMGAGEVTLYLHASHKGKSQSIRKEWRECWCLHKHQIKQQRSRLSVSTPSPVLHKATQPVTVSIQMSADDEDGSGTETPGLGL